jgi:hypothetical protein
VTEIPDEYVDEYIEPETASFYGGSMYSQKTSYGGYSGYNKPIQQQKQVQKNDITVGKPLFTKEKSDSTTLVPGDRVRHLTFGDGEIISAKKIAADTLYEVMFDKVGTKKLMATYAKLKKI